MAQRQTKARSERFVFCSGRIMLECRCGEVVVLLGRRTDWGSEAGMLFECGCGENLTLADRIHEEVATATSNPGDAFEIRYRSRAL